MPVMVSDEPKFRKPEGRLVWESLKEGLSPREITQKLGLRVDVASNYVKYWRSKGFNIPHFVKIGSNSPSVRMLLTFPRPIVMSLLRSAEKRNTSAEALIKKLVTVVVAERLIDGVLDDAD